MRKKSMVMTAMLSMSCIMAFMAAGCSKKIPEKTNHVVVEKDTETEIMTEKESEKQTGTEEQTHTEAPVIKPTEAPTQAPAVKPTEVPTQAPTEKPTEAPTQAPTEKPTEPATEALTQAPTEKPTEAPTQSPAVKPTEAPTQAPTEKPTEAPTQAPTVKPTEPATEAPTQAPSVKPTEPATEAPTDAPTEKSIWDYPFDVEAIKAQLIEWGEDIGLTHVTEHGVFGPATPENSSYDLPTFICKGFEGERAKKKVKEWLEYTPVSIYTYGGPQIKYFTIWMEEYEDGFIQIYFLY